MQIFVDADACPAVIKDILFRATERARVSLTLVANQPLRTPHSQFIRTLTVGAGFDVADARILQLIARGDLVVTADLPLAAAAIDKGATALNPRGERYTVENIRQALSVRNFLEELRGSGVATGGPPPFAQRDRHRFAGELDAWLAQHFGSTPHAPDQQ